MKIFRSNIIWNFCLWALFVIVLNGCFILGGGVGAYHIYLQNGGGGGGSCAIDVPCNLKYVDIFGFISIPVMASTGFLTIFLALLYYDLSRKEIVE